MKCQYCGSDLKPGAQFCEQCGGAVTPDSGPSIYPPANPVPPAQFAPPPSPTFTPTPPPVNPPAYIPNNPPVYTPPTPPPAAGNSNADMMAIVSTVLGVISLCAWFLPICGGPISLGALILGVLGLKSTDKRVFAIVGIITAAIGMLLSIGNAVLGAINAVNGFNYSG